MTTYQVLNDADEVTATIIADEQFMAANYSKYKLVSPPDTSIRDALAWRNAELKRTDLMAQTPDYPNRDDWVAYRTTLRDWPSTDSFPATKPHDPDYVEPTPSPPPPE